MSERIDRHNWFEQWGDLISDCIPTPTDKVPFPKFDRAKFDMLPEVQAFHNLVYNKEDNDCGVRALAVACAAPYDKAYAALQRAGRIDGYACCIAQMMHAARMLRCYMVRTPCTAKTLLTVERELAKTHGGFIASTSTHVVGIWNGELIDWARGRLFRLDDGRSITDRNWCRAAYGYSE